MKFITLLILFISLSLVSCGKKKKDDRRNDRVDKSDEINLVHNDVDVYSKISINFNAGYDRRIQPICRGINGCLHICDHFEQSNCKQLSADQVVLFWLNKISTYTSWEQAQRDLHLITTEPDISSFLKNMDKENQVAQALFYLSTAAVCPTGKQNFGFTHSPHATLFLKDSSSTSTVALQGQEKPKMKKIIDASTTPFNPQIFIGFIKKCFGHNTRTFSEMAIHIENKDAFNIGHQVISKACNGNDECIRLAYCDINSELVWNELHEDITAPGCEYSNFVEILP